MTDIYDFNGRWFTRNGMLVGVHINPDASKGNRVERWRGHDIPSRLEDIAKHGVPLPTLTICWNENGECVWVQGVVDDVKNYDLMERVNPQGVEEGIKVVGCKECEKNG